MRLKSCTYRLYIPFWLYSNAVGTLYFALASILYIPFWLYSNRGGKWRIVISKFSLHSILVIFQFLTHSVLSWLSLLYIPFWLYSNALAYEIEKLYIQTLHSILVIFQYLKSSSVNCSWVYFTFHSGYIPMYEVLMQSRKPIATLHSILVIFQWW